jgi:hypothetical protein
MATVLSIGVNKELLAQRHKALREAGFEVVSSGLGDTLAQLVADLRFQIAIFGPHVPEAERNRAAARLIRSCRHVKIIMLYEDAIRKAEMADAVLSVNGSPDDLIQTINYLLEKQGVDRQGNGRSA